MFNLVDVTLVLVTDANIQFFTVKINLIEKMRPKEVLEYILSNERINYSELAKLMGIPRVQPLYDIRDGKIKNISENYANKILAVFPKYNKGWLMSGEGETLKNTNDDGIHSVISSTDIKDDDYKGTLVYDIDATCGTNNRDIFSAEDNVIGSVNLPGINKQAHIIRANGDSMEPEIYDGNMVAVREIKSWDDIFYGQIYLVILDEYRMIKRIRRCEHDEENYVILRSDNPQYDDIKLHKGKIRRLFIVENILSVKNRM